MAFRSTTSSSKSKTCAWLQLGLPYGFSHHSFYAVLVYAAAVRVIEMLQGKAHNLNVATMTEVVVA